MSGQTDENPQSVLSYKSAPARAVEPPWPGQEFLVFAVDYTNSEEVRLLIRGNGLANVNATAKKNGLGPLGIFEWPADPAEQQKLKDRLPATRNWRDRAPIEDFDPRAAVPLHSTIVIDGMTRLPRDPPLPHQSAGRSACWIGASMAGLAFLVGLKALEGVSSTQGRVVTLFLLLPFASGVALIVLGVKVIGGKLLPAIFVTAILALTSLAAAWTVSRAKGVEIYLAAIVFLMVFAVTLQMTLALVHLIRHPGR